MDVLVKDTDQEPLVDPKADVVAQLRAERNRWFIISLVSLLIMALLVCFAWYAFSKAERNQEVVFVKLEPNGAWSVIDYQPEDGQLYFKTTIDALLERYSIDRYKVDGATVVEDWARAASFMSPEMERYFLDKNGFDAWGKIEQIQKSSNTATIEVRYTEHYDEVDWVSTAGEASKAIRSNIYLTRTLTTNGRKGKPELLVLSVQWRLISKEALVKEPLESLRYNPIGVEILNEQLKKERSSE